MAELAANMATPGVRFLSKAGKFELLDNQSGLTMCTGEYATQYAITISNTATDTQGGSANALLLRNYSGKIVQIDLTIRDWNLEYIAVSQGSLINVINSSKYVIEKVANVDTNGVVTLGTKDDLPLPVGNVSVKLPNNTRVNVVPGEDGTLNLTAYNVANECVNLTYSFDALGREIDILADGKPRICHLILQGDITDSKFGNVGWVEVDIPSYQVSPDLTITMTNDGTTSDTVLSGVALALSGQNCSDGMVYGKIKEYIIDFVMPVITELVTSPSPIELALTPTPETQQLTTQGSYGGAYAPVPVEGVTYTSASPETATVNATGVVTAVAVGTTQITSSYTNENSTVVTDVVDVTVVA